MFNKFFYFIKRHKNKGKCTLKQEKGFSLVEVIVAIVIISIVTVVLINGTIMAVNVSKMNRAKTLSSAVASEKLELIKFMDYEDIETEDINPNWPPLDDLDHPEYVELTEDGY
ncbi:MAG: prepilin-type N-terminal cleavage/methylation domain-containing protein, partial [Actinobacteria bacterium]|nr:prepilin-type N-terminal cleavage/methylation domain-containing protein [Actinomycetota bacterium]